MACPVKTWPLQREEFDALVAKAAKDHLVLTGDHGTTSLHGCTFDWSYENGSLSITCTGKPFFVSCETIYEKLDALLSS